MLRKANKKKIQSSTQFRKLRTSVLCTVQGGEYQPKNSPSSLRSLDIGANGCELKINFNIENYSCKFLKSHMVQQYKDMQGSETKSKGFLVFTVKRDTNIVFLAGMTNRSLPPSDQNTYLNSKLTPTNHKRYLNRCCHAIPCISGGNARTLIKNAIIVKKADRKVATSQPINAATHVSNAKKENKVKLLELLEMLADPPKAVAYLDGIIRDDSDTGRLIFARNSDQGLPLGHNFSSCYVIPFSEFLQSVFPLN
uniref:Uncharacterized protein n=1 Tax=Glossina pallidipes TaxID=7398 RepID=A0A1A9Z7P4_GLOPL